MVGCDLPRRTAPGRRSCAAEVGPQHQGRVQGSIALLAPRIPARPGARAPRSPRSACPGLRVRVGDLRISYTVEDDVLLVVFVTVWPSSRGLGHHDGRRRHPRSSADCCHQGSASVLAMRFRTGRSRNGSRCSPVLTLSGSRTAVTERLRFGSPFAGPLTTGTRRFGRRRSTGRRPRLRLPSRFKRSGKVALTPLAWGAPRR